jgi:hypothetical protein
VQLPGQRLHDRRLEQVPYALCSRTRIINEVRGISPLFDVNSKPRQRLSGNRSSAHDFEKNRNFRSVGVWFIRSIVAGALALFVISTRRVQVMFYLTQLVFLVLSLALWSLAAWNLP